MKKITLILVMALGLTLHSKAQQSGIARQAIGIHAGYGCEVSYLHPMGEKNRLELDLGMFYRGFNAAGTYQWTWDLSKALAPGFGWFVGPGLQLGAYGKAFNIGLCGQVGLEYNFSFPLQLTLDYRPVFMFLYPGDHGGFWGQGIALGVRYRLF